MTNRVLDPAIRAKIIVLENGCWHLDAKWNSNNGYSKLRYRGKPWMAHRLIYSLVIGEIPEGNVLDHLCRDRACCRPEHLEPVTQKANVRRGKAVLFVRLSK